MKCICKFTGFLFWVFLLFLTSCSSEKTAHIPDVSGIPLKKLKIERFEQDLFTIDSLNMAQSFEQIKEKYPEFLPLYLFNLQNIASKSDADEKVIEQLKSYISNKDIRLVYDDVSAYYSDLSSIENDFSEAFRYFKYHFPNYKTPQLFSYIAPFQHQAITIGSDKLGIGLDMHLGKDYPFYASAGHPNYLTKTFTKEHLLANSFMAFAKALLPENRDKARFIDKMIYNGKLLYFVEQMLPHSAKNLIAGYTTEQLEWCAANETQIWSFWIEKKLLYETKSNKYARFVSPSPTSSGMPPESPGNVGSWNGWQIVKTYMQNNPETTMEQLFQLEDGQQILKLSRYKPN